MHGGSHINEEEPGARRRDDVQPASPCRMKLRSVHVAVPLTSVGTGLNLKRADRSPPAQRQASARGEQGPVLPVPQCGLPGPGEIALPRRSGPGGGLS